MIAMNLDMTAAHQERVARIAVGASTARNQGGPGVVAAARQFFAGLDLRRFARRNARRYRAELDMATDELLGRLPPVAASWGLARKLLNIFIRDASYHVVLNAEYGLLDRAGRHMELPLDSLTAAGLKRALERGALPGWPGVKNVQPVLSARYQQAAAQVASRAGIRRVDLDVPWWGVRR